MSTSLVPHVRSPLAIATQRRQESILERAEAVIDEVETRRHERMDFWMGMMRDSEAVPLARLRASELSAKVDGDFETAKHPPPPAKGFLDMVRTRSTRLMELRDAMSGTAAIESMDRDEAEEAEFELV